MTRSAVTEVTEVQGDNLFFAKIKKLYYFCRVPLPGAPERDTAFLMLSQAPEFCIRGEQGKRFLLLYRHEI